MLKLTWLLCLTDRTTFVAMLCYAMHNSFVILKSIIKLVCEIVVCSATDVDQGGIITQSCCDDTTTVFSLQLTVEESVLFVHNNVDSK